MAAMVMARASSAKPHTRRVTAVKAKPERRSQEKRKRSTMGMKMMVMMGLALYIMSLGTPAVCI